MKTIAFGADLAKEKDVMRTKQFRRVVQWICVAVASAATLSADSITFSLLPGDGNLSGASGSLVGWGYSITNNSSADWFLATDLNADSFANGTPTSLFDFPEVGPGQTVTEAFDAVKSIGLFELQWAASAPSGFVNAGSFVLSGQWWNGDPFNGGSLIASATDAALPYSAAVSGGAGSNTAEPAGGYLLIFGIGLAAIWRWRSLFCGLARSERWREMKVLGGLSKNNPVGRKRAIWTAVLIVNLAFAGFSQSGSSPAQAPLDEPGITHEQANQILQELKEIRHLLEKQARPMAPAPMKTVPQTGKMRLEGGFSLGSADAPITIVEFTDYECQFCRQFESTTFVELRKKYVDTGKVRFVIRDFPLSIHPSAMRAAEATRCAGDQGKFWPMHDALFSGPPALEVDQLARHAQDLKLDGDQFRTCLGSGKHKSEVRNDMRAASALQILGTPSFLVGKTESDELDGDILVGAQPLSAFETRLRETEGH